MLNVYAFRWVITVVVSLLPVVASAVVIDFETDEPAGAGGTALVAGDVIGPGVGGPQPYADDGVIITVVPGGGGGPLMIFDSANPTGGDTDIGSPNEDCPGGGPGIGVGGAPGGAGPNCVPLGNILIISQNGNSAVPNDSNAGGVITFEFAVDASIGAITSLDDVAGEFRTFDVNDILLASTPFIGLEENEFDTFAIGNCASRVEVDLNGSGAIPSIEFEPTICTNLTLTKDNGQLVYTPGADVTYTITVTNNGPRDIPAGAVITDNVPAGTTFVSTTGCTEDPTGSPTCTLGAIASGASVNVSFTINVPVDFTGDLTNTATVAAPPGTTETDFSDNTDSDTDTGPELIAAKVVSDANGNGFAEPGETLTYTISVTNNTSAEIGEVDILDLVDDPGIIVDLAQLLVIDNAGAETDPDTDINIGNLTGVPFVFDSDVPANSTITVSYTVIVADPIAAGDLSIDNSVVVVSGDGAITPTAGDIDACAVNPTACTTTIPIADPELTLVKNIVSGSPYDSVNDIITYSFQVTNTGNIALAGPVTINDDLTVDESCPAVTTVGNGDGNLDVGESITCTASFTITQAELDAGSVTNTADASADGTTSNEDSATAFEVPVLVAVKTVNDANGNGIAEPGETLTYTIQITNSGGSVADNALVQDAVNDSNIVVDGGQVLSITNASDFIPAIPTISTLQAGFTLDIAPGVTASITYTVVVSNPITINLNGFDTHLSLNNKLFSLLSASKCASDLCSTI